MMRKTITKVQALAVSALACLIYEQIKRCEENNHHTHNESIYDKVIPYNLFNASGVTNYYPDLIR
jgi:hypothetical protein